MREFRERMQHARELREKLRARPTYQELSEHERYPGLDRESARPPLEMIPTPGRYRHSYAEPPRLGLAALHPYWCINFCYLMNYLINRHVASCYIILFVYCALIVQWGSLVIITVFILSHRIRKKKGDGKIMRKMWIFSIFQFF